MNKICNIKQNLLHFRHFQRKGYIQIVKFLTSNIHIVSKYYTICIYRFAFKMLVFSKGIIFYQFYSKIQSIILFIIHTIKLIINLGTYKISSQKGERRYNQQDCIIKPRKAVYQETTSHKTHHKPQYRIVLFNKC